MSTVVVIAKAPAPGRVKTRLCPPCTPTEAADLAAAALADTLAAVDASRCERRVLAIDGHPGPWVPDGWEFVPQCGGTLADRLEAVMVGIDGPCAVLGMDTPQLTPDHLDALWSTLLAPGVDAALGPARDGGFWTLAVRSPRSGLFEGVEMSTARTGRDQRARLEALGLRVADLGELRDVDTYADARAVAAECPHSHFAMRLSRVGVAA